MLFYGKEIDIFYIILLVIFILVVYILISFYMQQKKSIALRTSSQPIISKTSLLPIPIKPNEVLERGAFAISLWLNITSWVPPTVTDASFNILTLNNTNANQVTKILNLYIDANCKLAISSNTTNALFPIYQITSSTLPINEPVNIILNYNGDDDYKEDEDVFLRDSDGNIQKDGNGKPRSIYNTDAGSFVYNNRALDVFINGRLNNTIILNNTLTGQQNGSNFVSFMDASMNYLTNNNLEIYTGTTNVTPGPDGTISNVTFIKGGCSIEDAQSINNDGNSSNILDTIFSYKLRFSLLEDNKEIKVYDT
jgi:hypothetical protein